MVVDVVRGGPGLGNIAPEQSDYFAMVKGGGHGNYRNLVLAPASVQEMADLTVLAFELADKYRNPAVILADGFIGQMMEPLDLEYRDVVAPEKPWAVKGTPETRKNLVSSIFLEPDDLEAHQRHLEAKYQRAQQEEQRWELYDTRGRRHSPRRIRHHLARSALGRRSGTRAKDQRVGLFRPITLWPFPSEALRKAAADVRQVVVVELSNGQMVEDVRLALNGRVPVEFYGRTGGNVPVGGRDSDRSYCTHGEADRTRNAGTFRSIRKRRSCLTTRRHCWSKQPLLRTVTK